MMKLNRKMMPGYAMTQEDCDEVAQLEEDLAGEREVYMRNVKRIIEMEEQIQQVIEEREALVDDLILFGDWLKDEYEKMLANVQEGEELNKTLTNVMVQWETVQKKIEGE